MKDSKLLSPRQRELLFDGIIKAADSYEILIIEPWEVDKAVESTISNLNWLEADKTIEILNRLKADTAIIDSPSRNKARYGSYIRKGLKQDTELKVEHKADLNYPSVSAASILAKVTRDREIGKLKEKIGINFGSGYPSDPLTVSFLKNNYQSYPNIFRKSWESYKAVAMKKTQKRLLEY